jgi:curved DNA-binding protein
MAATDFKDYYSILGVSRSAEADEIKKAFRRLARQYHPDLNPGDKAAEARFKEINEAYEVLSDPDKRGKYDKFGQYWKHMGQSGTTSWPGAGAGSSSFEDFEFSRFNNFDEFINELLGRYTSGGGAGYSSYQTPGASAYRNSTRGFNDFGFGSEGPSRAQNLDRDVNLTLTLAEAFHGTEKRLNMGGEMVDVRIPPGIKAGNKVRLKGKGYQYGSQRGDLYLLVALQPHAFFQLEGENLSCEVPITPDEAALGAQIQVPTPDGSVTVNVPAGIRSGQSLRLKGKGWPTKSGRGDQMVRVVITVPKSLSSIERELYEKIRANRTANPRSTLQDLKL